MNTTTNNQAIETATTGSEIETSHQYTNSEVTTMTTETNTQATETTTTKPAKAKKAPQNYPFTSKAQLMHWIMTDDGFARAALVTIWEKQTAHEQDKRITESRNCVGFMSSHSVNGSKLAEKISSGVALDGEEMVQCRAIASRYTRQLARFAREEALAENPELAATAAVFGL